ncbi:MAG: hypothetical protein RLZZ543_1202 [Bacteroidota bacterium]|jgi:hypothetical protein
MNSTSYTLLIHKLDEFIRKYYTNLLIRGIIYSVGALVIFFLLTSLIEYWGHLGTNGRAFLFYTYIGVSCFLVIRFILLPVFHLARIGRIISYDQAAEIIGHHFSDVRDKLINTLQLQRVLENDQTASALVAASIDQRIQELRPIPFTAAIDNKQNKKYAKLAAIPVTLFILLWAIYPAFIRDSSHRILNYSTPFEPLAPFSFIIENSALETPTQQDFVLKVKTGGEELPDEMYISQGDLKLRLLKEDKLHFSYTFKNVQHSQPFRLYADGFYSKEYELKALPNPTLTNFRIQLDYPEYTGKKDEFISNTGDLVIPAGTKATWEFNTQNTDQLLLQFSDTSYQVKETEKGKYAHAVRFLKDNRYRIKASNQFIKGKDQVEYTVSVKPDEYPSIQSEEKQDSLASARVYFKGDVEDDYGFNKLIFSYRHFNGERTIELKSQDVPFNRNFLRTLFFWTWDFSTLSLQPGDEVEYWFEVFDNDGVHGPKSSKTQKKIFKVPSMDEIEEKRDQNNESMKGNIKETLQDAKKLQKELDELNRRILEKKEINWQDKKKVQDLINKQQQIEKQIEDLKKENQENNSRNEEFRKSDERILEKQKELEKMFDQILSEDMKEKLKELERMMENLDKNKLKDMIDQMKLENKDIEKELDRSLELFKQLEFDEKFNSTIDKLDKLKEKQEELAAKSEQKNANSDELKKEQDQLNKEFESLRKDMDELQKKNEQLENPQSLENTDQMEQDIQQEMQNSSESLQNSKSGKASKSQKSASQKMQEMSDKMKQAQQSSEEESLEEDVSKLREILENLLQLSFDQEKLMKQLQRTPPANPLYVKITADQKKIRDDARMIEDSLFALSKRVAQIQSFINREISSINMNLDKTIGYMAERQSPNAASRQQFVMTSINNLALMLSEVVQQMQQQMAQQQQQKEGSGSCKKPGKNKKPGSGSPSMSTLRQLQEQLNEQMKQMKEGQKPGQKPGQGEKGTMGSQQLAKMAAQQEMLRNELQKMMNEMMKDGNSGNAGELKNLANKMEQTETDIVNKNITLETMRRQQEIMTRLLEAERAERERELDTKRESNENKIDQKRNISVFNQYTRQMQQEAELLKTLSPSLKPFYRNMVKDYFNTIN